MAVAVAQRRPETEAPARDDLYQVGTLVRVLQIFRGADGSRPRGWSRAWCRSV